MTVSPRKRLYEVLELGRLNDPASWLCDQILIVLIVANVAAAIAESMPELLHAHREFFVGFEIFSVAVFTIEYVLRIYSVVESPDAKYQDPVSGRIRYSVSAIALTDLAAILPFFLSSVIGLDLRTLRLLRLLRIFKLAHYFSTLGVLIDVIKTERHAFGAAYFIVVLGLLMAGSGVYVFEHKAQPEAFGSIPASLWWAVVTLTTVGYGDATPITLGGKMFGGFVMMLGVGIVAIPTGILATRFALELQRRRERYADEVRSSLEDGRIDEQERAHLERLREKLALSREVTCDLEEEEGDASLESIRPRFEPMVACPHCGESLNEPVKDSLATTDG